MIKLLKFAEKKGRINNIIVEIDCLYKEEHRTVYLCLKKS